jgi:S1-C subfamily serine protease
MSKTVWTSLVSAVVGGAVVAGILLGVGGVKERVKTVTRFETAGVAASTGGDLEKGALTAHQIYERDAPGVVFVSATVVHPQENSPFELFRGENQQRSIDTGSGIVINSNGTILTNWHVVANAVKVTVSFSEHGKAVPAQVVGKDPSKDLAVLKVPTEGLSLDPLKLGNSAEVQVGEVVYAIGNPFDLERTLTSGIVSALQRQIQAPNGFAITNVIQTDAPINPGNSGGPLLNDRGEVIGINSQIETAGTDGNIGIGFAIPINTAKAELPELEKGGTVKEAYLGVATITIDGSLSLPGIELPVREGALVEEVLAGSPAQKAGLKGGDVTVQADGARIAIGGDIIVGIDGHPVRSSEELANVVLSHRPGETVSVEMYAPNSGGHGYHKTSVNVTLGSRPTSKPKAAEEKETGLEGEAEGEG